MRLLDTSGADASESSRSTRASRKLAKLCLRPNGFAGLTDRLTAFRRAVTRSVRFRQPLRGPHAFLAPPRHSHQWLVARALHRRLFGRWMSALDFIEARGDLAVVELFPQAARRLAHTHLSNGGSLATANADLEHSLLPPWSEYTQRSHRRSRNTRTLMGTLGGTVVDDAASRTVLDQPLQANLGRDAPLAPQLPEGQWTSHAARAMLWMSRPCHCAVPVLQHLVLSFLDFHQLSTRGGCTMTRGGGEHAGTILDALRPLICLAAFSPPCNPSGNSASPLLSPDLRTHRCQAWLGGAFSPLSSSLTPLWTRRHVL